MRQGYLGNCWFISAAAALAEVPQRVENLFVNDAVNDEGIYALQFYTLGHPHHVVIDDYLPSQPSGSGYRTIYANLGFDNSLWGAFLEKAFAKYMGNYLHIEGGWMRMGAHYLNGSPYLTKWHNQTSSDDLWALITQYDGADDIIQSATHFAEGGHDW